MKTTLIPVLGCIAIFTLPGCSETPVHDVPTSVGPDETTRIRNPMTDPTPELIEAAIEGLVYIESPRKDAPVHGTDAEATPDEKQEAENKSRYVRCEESFRTLTLYGPIAFPYLVRHLKDPRPSIDFRNHYLGNSVGDACLWNLYFQIAEMPYGYSEYGYSRKGRDGEDHVKPRWDGTPFDADGGAEQWLKKRAGLRYEELQIEGLRWFLDAETKIGACDADSYFLNILPLEIAIEERRELLAGKPSAKLVRLKKIRDKRLVDAIPPGLLPEKK